MGCDIHFFTERYTTDDNYEGPKYVVEPIDEFYLDIPTERELKIGNILSENALGSVKWITADKWKKDDENRWRSQELYDGRDYRLFNALAGVRGNGGVSNPKGVPIDASEAYRYMVKSWDGDGHSHSYFTLSELLKVDWKKYDVEYFTETIEKMKKIDPDPEKVRCVFFFDN